MSLYSTYLCQLEPSANKSVNLPVTGGMRLRYRSKVVVNQSGEMAIDAFVYRMYTIHGLRPSSVTFKASVYIPPRLFEQP